MAFVVTTASPERAARIQGRRAPSRQRCLQGRAWVSLEFLAQAHEAPREQEEPASEDHENDVHGVTPRASVPRQATATRSKPLALFVALWELLDEGGLIAAVVVRRTRAGRCTGLAQRLE